MGLSAGQIRHGLDAVAADDPRVARALKIAGYPEPRIRERGHRTLLRTIVGQQVSVAAADSVWAKLEAEIGSEMAPERIIEADYDTLRACGMSRQKQGYARSLCELVAADELDLENLPEDDEAAISELTKIKGIGRWSAEIYLLFAEGRPDIWPAGDLAVQKATGKIVGLDEAPSEKETRAIAEDWRPHRGAMAVFTWHAYYIPTL
ncbi:DNA-3-methyladenine glycosylase 2 family protein [Citromicrobium bathyomarinum]|uniref:DNA-3-methyladenine glycosylase family protein n=1 Tax=Citromicrobium bathyomarinum TaxID=72174 RepID=UPI00315AF5E4